MSLLKRLLNFYIFSNIHVAVAAFSLTVLTVFTLEIYDFTLPFLVFFSTILSYNLIRFFSLKTINKWSFNFIKSNRIALIFLTSISAIAIVYLFLQLSWRSMLFLLPFMGFTLFYFLPVKWKGASVTLRKIAVLKIFLIAFSWASVTFLLPLLEYEIKPNLSHWLEYVQRLLFLLVMILPFDIRDMDNDELSLKTLPQRLGVTKVKRLGLLLMMLFLGLDIMAANSADFRIHLMVAFATLLLLLKATTKQNKYFSAFWVESLPIFWLLIYLMY